jgi:GMP synthase-like glutamine amidotransferase
VWHFDTFDLPPGAVLLARTERFPHAFRAGTALGIQSHPEATPEIVAAWAADPRAAARLADAGLDPDGLVADVEAHAAATSAVAAEVFGRWAASL